MKPIPRGPRGAQASATMSRLRPRAQFVLVLVALLIAELSGAAAYVALRHDEGRPVASEPASNPDSKYRPAPKPTPVQRVRPPPVKKPVPVVSPPRAKPTPKPTPRKPVVTLAALRGLGTWVDLYDYGKPQNRPVRTLVAQAAAQNVATIWVETSRYNTADIAYPAALGELMDASAARGIRVIAWVLPEFRSVSADLKKAKAAAAFRSPGGRRFAALALDIEVSSGAKAPERTSRLTSLMRAVYGHVGMPVVNITPPPVGFQRNPTYWPGFPWREVGAYGDAIATMGYWSYRDSDPGPYTADAIRQTRQLVGRSSYPVHVIGGLAAETSVSGAAAFCAAARSGRALGASLYDLTSMPASLWKPMQACRQVGH